MKRQLITEMKSISLTRNAQNLSFALATALALATTAVGGAAKTPELPAALKKMQEKYASVKTLTTQFVQRQRSVALGTTKESSGRIYFKRPDRFRWETHEPASSASILVSNGKKVWFYTPPARPDDKKSRGQVLVRKAADVQSRLAMDLLAGSADLRKNFRIKQLSPDGDRFDLAPLKPAGDIEHIELFVERPTNLVYKLILFTTIGNETQLELKNVEFGPDLKDAMFNFVPPENTEEIH